MRVASMQSVQRYQTQLNDSYELTTKLMEQADGNKLHRPSDDSVGYSQWLRYENSNTYNLQYQSNVKTGISWMKSADSAMVDMTDIMKGLVAKTVNAANDSNTTENLQEIAKEFEAKVQQIVSLGNTQSGDRYLFSGQSDLTRPFTISTEKMDRGLTKTLNDSQSSFFERLRDANGNSVDASGNVVADSDAGVVLVADATGNAPQMLALKGDDGETYYLSTLSGHIYTEDFVENGYKDQIAQGYTGVQAGDEIAQLTLGTGGDFESVSTYFQSTGVLKDDGTNWTYAITVDGETVNLQFDSVKQYIVTYNGDAKHISMVKQNGSVDVTADTVNATGQDLFGADIFDNSNSGNQYYTTYNGETKTVSSGVAALNDLLTVCAKLEAGDNRWMSSDGITLADSAHAVVVEAQTSTSARQNVYESVSTMLVSQNEVILGDITNVSGTDVAELAVKMMEAQTLYNMMLSVGARILPTSLADYL